VSERARTEGRRGGWVAIRHRANRCAGPLVSMPWQLNTHCSPCEPWWPFRAPRRDLNKRAFLKEAQKLVPSITEDMVEESFSGVMAQVFMEDGKAAKDYIFERKVRERWVEVARMGGKASGGVSTVRHSIVCLLFHAIIHNCCPPPLADAGRHDAERAQRAFARVHRVAGDCRDRCGHCRRGLWVGARRWEEDAGVRGGGAGCGALRGEGLGSAGHA
jgi:hypothetical protein